MTRRDRPRQDRGWVYNGPKPQKSKPVLIRSASTSLVRLDTATIREKALKDFSKAEQALAQLKTQLKDHEERDIPDFKSWMHRTFAAALTRQRELAHKLKETQSLLFEIQDVALRFDLSDVEAYRKAIFRRANPEAAEEEDRVFYEEERKREEARQRRRKRQPGDDIFDDLFSGDPKEDFANKEDYDEFSDFMEDMTGYRPPDMHEDNWRESVQKSPQDVKDIYRTIVRQLHPDMNGQMDDAKAALWHEAQEAYRRQDVGALHSVLGRCKGEDKPGAHSPVGLILMMTQHLKKSARSLRADIAQAKRHPAWDFLRRSKSPAYVNRIRSQLENENWQMNHQLTAMTHELQDLERMSTRIPPKRKPNRRNPMG